MEECGQRKKKSVRPGRRVRRVLRLALMAAVLLSALFLLLEKNLEQVILSMAYARAEAMAVEYIHRAAEDVMGGQAALYSEMVAVRTDAQGRVTMLEANAARMNQLATLTALRAQEMLRSAEQQSVGIPLGAALGIPFLSAAGPRVQVRILPVGAVSAAFSSEFESAGINQTRHKIYLSMHTSVRLVIPTGASTVDLNSQVLIAESIIVGEVPGSYVNVPETEDALNFAIP